MHQSRHAGSSLPCRLATWKISSDTGMITLTCSQATMAAIDYTVANYPTTHVWAHGTSAGSIGV